LDGVLEVQLYVRQVRSESFRQYTLVADNGVASATASVSMVPSTSLPVFGRPLQVTVRPMLRDRCPVCL